MLRTLHSASRGVKVSFAVIAISIVVVSIGIGALGATLFLRAQSESELRSALISTCESSPLKEAEIEDQEEAIVSARDPQIRQLFPNVPQAVIDQIVAKGNAKHRARIAHIEDVDCGSHYH